MPSVLVIPCPQEQVVHEGTTSRLLWYQSLVAHKLNHLLGRGTGDKDRGTELKIETKEKNRAR